MAITFDRTIGIDISNVEIPSGASEIIATSWQVANFPYFENKYFIIGESIFDKDNIENITLNMTCDVYGNKIYYRTKFYFDNGAETEWSDAVTIAALEGQPVEDDVLVATPNVNAAFTYDNNINGELVINTKPIRFFLGTGEHHSTSWDVVNNKNIIVASSLVDTTNLTKFVVPADNIFDGMVYRLNVKHYSTVGVESGTSHTTFSTIIKNGKYFDMSLISNPVVTKPIYSELSLHTTQFAAVELKIEDNNGNVLATSPLQSTLTPFISVDASYTGLAYFLKARLKLKDGTYTAWKTISNGTLQGNYLIEINPSFTYLGKYSYIGTPSLRGATVQFSTQLYDGTVLLTKYGSKTIYQYDVQNGALVNEKEAIVLEAEDNIAIPYINIRALYTGDVLINYASNTSAMTDQRSAFKLFSYNPVSRTFTQKKYSKKETEWLSTGVSGSMFICASNNAYYVPAVEVDDNEQLINLSMYKLNTTSFEFTQIPLPFAAKRHVSVIPLTTTTCLVLGGSVDSSIVNNETIWTRDNNNIYLFNTTDQSFTKVASFPDTIVSSLYNFQGYLRKDGKVILFNSVRSGASVGNQNTIIINPVDYSFTVEQNDMSDGLVYRTTIPLTNGDFIRITSNAEDPQQQYLYVGNSITKDNLVDNTSTEKPLRSLIIGINQELTVEDIGQYSFIAILGTDDTNTGLLHWQIGDNVQTYNYRDLVVPNSIVMSYDAFNAGNFSSVNIIGDTTLTLEA